MGSVGDSTAGKYAGVTHVFEGPITGDFHTEDAVASLYDAKPGDNAGTSVEVVEDLDLDGHDELLTGAPMVQVDTYGGGAAHLVYGPVSGTMSLADADATFFMDLPYAKTGSDLEGSGDYTGDGSLDPLVSGVTASGLDQYTGMVYIIPGEGSL